MKKVCILGGGGYFGQHITSRFQQEGYHTNVLDLNFEPQPPNIVIDKQKMTVFKGSIIDEILLQKALSECEVCVHIAAYGMGGPGALNRKLIFQINYDGTVLVMDYCRKLGVKRFINSSSVGVILTDQPLDMVDENYPYPKKYYSHYSESKAKAERAVKAANDAQLKTVSLRYRGIYGAGEPKSTDRAAEVIYRGLYIAEFGDGSPTMTQYSGVHNIVEANILSDKALKEKPEVVGGKVYNIVDGGPPVHTFGFWYPLLKCLNRPTPIIRIPFRLMFLIGWLCEMGCFYFGFNPTLIRLEVAMMGLTNTYSIENARRDLGYNPTVNHDMAGICSYYQQYYERNPSWTIDISRLKILFALVVLLITLFMVFFRL